MKVPQFIPIMIAFACPVFAGEPGAAYPDLLPEHRTVADADNAWIALKALPAFRLGDVTMETWREATRIPVLRGKAQPFVPDVELVRKLAAENAELLEKVRSLQKLPAFQIAAMEPMGVEDTLVKVFKPWIGALKLNGLLATVEASEGKFGQEWEDTLATAQAGFRMLQSGPSFVGMVFARSPISAGADWSLRAGRYAKTSAPLKQRAADLAAFESVHELFPEGAKQEFRFQQRLLEILRDGGEPRLRLFVKMHLGSQFMAEVLKSLEREMQRKKGEPEEATPEPPGEKEEAALMKEPPAEVLMWESLANATDWAAIEEHLVSSTRKILSAPLTTPEAFSRALAEELKEAADAEAKEKAMAEAEATSAPPAVTIEFSAAAGVHRQLCKTSLEVRQTRIALALLAWELDNPGAPKLPASLDVLVPAYLPALPVNPMNGEPIGYEPARRLLTGTYKQTRKDGEVTNNLADLPIPPLVR